MPRPSLIGGCGHLCPIRPSPRRPQWSPTYNWASVAFSNNLRLPTECFKMKFSLSNFKKQTKKQTFLFAVCYWTKKGNSIKVRYYSILSSAHFWWRTHPKGVGGGEMMMTNRAGSLSIKAFYCTTRESVPVDCNFYFTIQSPPPPHPLSSRHLCLLLFLCLSVICRERPEKRKRKKTKFFVGRGFLSNFVYLCIRCSMKR